MSAYKVSFKSLLYILVGNLGLAAALDCFFTPNEIAAGGFGGIGVIVNSLLPVSVGTVVFVISVPVFVWSWFSQGPAYTVSALYTLLNTRLTAGRKTVISSNLTVEELGARYSPAIMSRLLGEFHTVKFAGSDVRLKKKSLG